MNRGRQPAVRGNLGTQTVCVRGRAGSLDPGTREIGNDNNHDERHQDESDRERESGFVRFRLQDFSA